MAKRITDVRVGKQRTLALDPPRISVLSDQPLPPEQTWRESFNLRYKVGPIYDILRHPQTRTPLAMAIYGSWGAGKTTAMKWLHGLLDIWNKQAKGKERVKVTPVWFYPWKYHTKEDVWRGLVAEVIIRGISVGDPSMAKVTNAAKRFGVFLGRSFVHALASVKLKAQVPGDGPGVEVSLAGIKDILEEYRSTNHPEAGFLNEFEDSLRTWIDDTLGENERMVIFIDDLDRCMPDVALQVLEALKLYLNIEKLIFVVGVDRDVIQELVVGHYKELKLNPDKSKQYLAKMFQVEVDLSPSERLIEGFLDEQFANLPFWSEELSEMGRDIFRERIRIMAGRNPREVKRLINSAMMEGAGALMVTSDEDNPEDQLTIPQGLQLFFVRKILSDKYTMGSLVGGRLGDRFFGHWSQIVREHEDEKDFPRTVQVPAELLERASESARDGGILPQHAAGETKQTEKTEEPDLSFAPVAYHKLLKRREFGPLLELLADPNLGELMRIEYPTDTEVVAAATGSTSSEGLIREAIAREVNKKPEELTEEDFARVTQLDLGGLEISDLKPLSALTNLQDLSLRETPVSDLKPLSGVTSLQRLCLDGTQSSDFKPLSGLTNLQGLYVSSTPVSDLTPLSGLANLQRLALGGTKVSDLKPLIGLTNLAYIWLGGVPVSDEDVEELKKALPNLTIAG